MLGSMTRRLLMTIGAIFTTLALSASVALAAAPTKPTGQPSTTPANAHSCSHSSTYTGAAKPTADHGKPTTVPPARGNQGDNDESDDTNTNEGGADGQSHNHGWYVSQVARDHSITGRAHGQAVSAEARSEDGKP
jgi:hypothetical protein